MGVTNLWQILEPVRQPISLTSLKGKTLAVDLSLWVCEAQTVKNMIGVVTKPHLRNIFFRISFLTSMGIKLVFVMEGEAPRLKADTLSKRNEMRYGPSTKVRAARTGRSVFKAILKECLELLECLGVPWVQAAGEAEAMCACLNEEGLVDGCITNDGDVFLYGAQTVYRNFAMNAKDPHLDCYTMSSIKEKLGCDRESLIGLAILLGCDYLPKIFASEKMEWSKHYACKKLLVLLTYYDMIQRKHGYFDSKQMQAIRIVKARVKNGIPCFEIEWQKPEHYVDGENEPAGLFVVTVEEESLFQAAYPDIVALYQVEKSEVRKKKQKTRKDRPKEKELSDVYDEVTNLLSQMNLKTRCGILPVQDSVLDRKTPPEDQLHQGSTESKDTVLAAASCISTVQKPASAAVLPLTASCYSLQSTVADSSVLPAQFSKSSGMSTASSITSGLQLSSIDWEGTFFSGSSAHGGDAQDPAANLTAGIKHSHPLDHETVRNRSEYSGAMQSDQHHLDSADDLVLNDAMGQLQKSLTERILKKTSMPSKPLLSAGIMQLEPLKCFKQTEETLNLDEDYIPFSCKLNKVVQESKSMLSEKRTKDSGVHVYQDEYERADNLAGMMQKGHNIISLTSLALSGQTTRTLHPGCEVLQVSQKPADVVTGCHIEKAYIQATWKTSSKKSVCQNRCSSSEDSDDGNINKNQIYEQQKRQLNHSQFKKCFTKKRSNVVSGKRTNSDSALVIEGKEKPTTSKKDGNSFLLQVTPKPASLGDVNCFQSPEQQFERLGSGPTQQAKGAVLSYAWADSPLPLSERLKRRIQIN
ncbi:flap endonuclease GEN homolog 1 isoform X2 [Neopsephotus bourkii]|uniref:flap endonuclease GEN homolog 1 isoform X2 n=1 Tax=Neopsephotus bourkii TaxID=309878 RepID=UPI002AA50A88|nr:flap endonuclease GEN homolog 1 isoform X2 [Neopsephotus bourkii]